jgi:hypothetical protein
VRVAHKHVWRWGIIGRSRAGGGRLTVIGPTAGCGLRVPKRAASTVKKSIRAWISWKRLACSGRSGADHAPDSSGP